ncbi:uncharacterized protein V1518DRAFT_420321 [Limtongia smithiae]|uniref:uncharacterized protein n=1 Tax=Limtongia smithiae TaxID=1125753 RepID=UPI0034CE919B
MVPRLRLLRARRLPPASCRSTRAFSATAAKRAEVEVTVDGVKVHIEAGSALIQACEKAGALVPRFCYHEKLAIAGNCRMCLVDVERAPKAVASCAFPVQNGMVVHTNSERVLKAREGVMEMLLSNHPLDCPVCDQGGECDLQDQAMRYGSDRGRFYEIEGKRATEDKDMGPLIKTEMTRCIQCTRCVRFANDVAGAPELGTSGRGNDMQIGMYLQKNLNSELSGNVIDLCPVGALTSKPYAFRARPWELKKTESVDVLDGLGSNIRVDSRGVEVLRVLPRLNDDVNEEWISDKSRFAVDGLKTQRLTVPLVRVGDRFETVTWDEAMSTVVQAYEKAAPTGGEFKAIAGALVDVEALVAMKDLANRLGSENLVLDGSASELPAHGVDVRTNYLFNATIHGIEEADAILLVGTNPRMEAAVLNARIRKQWLRSELTIGLVGEHFDSTFEYTHYGEDAAALKSALSGEFGKTLLNAKKPIIVVGSGVAQNADAKTYFEVLGQFVNKNAEKLITPEWNAYSVLHRSASAAGAYDVGFVPALDPVVAATTPKFVWLLAADEITDADVPKDAFVVYQGHHGDVGAQYADVILPSSAYTEKAGTYVNTEGRVQVTRAATSPPGVARDDWKILRAVSEYLGVALPYDDIYDMRTRLSEIAPHLVRHDIIEPSTSALAATGVRTQLVDANRGVKSTGDRLRSVIENFYFTDAISRSSPTLAKASVAFAKGAADEEGLKAYA